MGARAEAEFSANFRRVPTRVDVLFCHGLESGPVGRKSEAFRAAGHRVIAPDCRNLDLARRVDCIAAVLPEVPHGTVVVGSSFGGLAAVCALQLADRVDHLAGAVLAAPALHVQQPPADTLELRAVIPTVILHGVRDTVVPVDVSRRYATRTRCELIEVDDDHQLAASMETLLDLIGRIGVSPSA